MSNKGIDIRKSGDTLVFRASLKDASGAKVSTGTTTLALLELQSDGTFKTYDWSTNTFKANGMTAGQSTTALTHRSRITDADATVTTGLWTGTLATLTGLTAGSIYIAQVTNSGASPTDQEREFQYGSVEGDSAVQTGDSYARLNAIADSKGSIELDGSLVAYRAQSTGKVYFLKIRSNDGTGKVWDLVLSPTDGELQTYDPLRIAHYGLSMSATSDQRRYAVSVANLAEGGLPVGDYLMEITTNADNYESARVTDEFVGSIAARWDGETLTLPDYGITADQVRTCVENGTASIRDRTNLIASTDKIIVKSPARLDADGTPIIEIVRGDSYEDDYQIRVAFSAGATIVPNDCTGLPVKLRYQRRGSQEAATELTGEWVTASGADKEAKFPLTSDQSNELSPDGDYACDVGVWVAEGKRRTVVRNANLVVGEDLR